MRTRLGLALTLAAALILASPDTRAQSGTYYVATTGSNTTGNGSASQPWATITHALSQVPDGSLILVRPGTYTGEVLLNRAFTQGVTIRSETPYQARLRHTANRVGRWWPWQGVGVLPYGPGGTVCRYCWP